MKIPNKTVLFVNIKFKYMQNKVKSTNMKDVLPHGSAKDIAKIAGVTTYTVSRVLNGKSDNRKVLKAIKSYLSELQSEKTELENLVNNI